MYVYNCCMMWQKLECLCPNYTHLMIVQLNIVTKTYYKIGGFRISDTTHFSEVGSLPSTLLLLNVLGILCTWMKRIQFWSRWSSFTAMLLTGPTSATWPGLLTHPDVAVAIKYDRWWHNNYNCVQSWIQQIIIAAPCVWRLNNNRSTYDCPEAVPQT